MQSVNIRQLRDTRRLKTWLRAGKTVELRERDRVIARIVPAGQPAPPAPGRFSVTESCPEPIWSSRSEDAIDGLCGYQFCRFAVCHGCALSGSPTADGRAPLVWFTPLHHAEWAHAIAQHVFHGKVSATGAQELNRHLKEDRAAGLWVEAEMPEGVFEDCADLARRYGPRLGVRTLDCLHVACALQLKAEQFWTFDERQAKLAKVTGLKSL
jgi:predicted nucleic acid-binding protein/antitoxin (DNA-binding transcriptional repressor) of toxin-antitoxin stability system